MPPTAATAAGRRVHQLDRQTDERVPDRSPSRGNRPDPPDRQRTARARRPASAARTAAPARPSKRAVAAAAALETELLRAPGPAATRAGAGTEARPASPAWVPIPDQASLPRRSPTTRAQPARTETRPAGPKTKARTRSVPRLALHRPAAPRLDRIVRGRAWIPVLGIILVAIVGVRVEVLKLGAGVGTQVQEATALESSNAVLRAQIAALSDSSRILRMAAGYGMVMPNVLDIHFVQSADGRNVTDAIRNIAPPAPTTYLNGLVAERQLDARATIAGSNLSAIGAAPSSGVGTTTVTAANGVGTQALNLTAATVQPLTPANTTSGGTSTAPTPATGGGSPSSTSPTASSTSPTSVTGTGGSGAYAGPSGGGSAGSGVSGTASSGSASGSPPSTPTAPTGTAGTTAAGTTANSGSTGVSGAGSSSAATSSSTSGGASLSG